MIEHISIPENLLLEVAKLDNLHAHEHELFVGALTMIFQGYNIPAYNFYTLANLIENNKEYLEFADRHYLNIEMETKNE